MLSTWLVTSLADDGTSGTLRWAIEQANNAVGHQTVTFDPALTENAPATIQLTGATNPLIISNTSGGVEIDGPGENLLTIHAAQGPFPGSSALLVESNATGDVRNMTITGASYLGAYGSGNVVNLGTLYVNECTISGSHAANGPGGGIYNQGDLIVLSSTISDNRAIAGGGIWSSGNLWIAGSTVSGNTANIGGGILAYAGTLNVTDCTITGNTSSHTPGGGIESYSSVTGTILDATITDNTAENNGGGIDAGSELAVENTIIAQNTKHDINGVVIGPSDIQGTVTGTYNLIGDGSGGLSADPADHNVLGTSANPIDPMLSALGDYGGLTQTMEELPGSPALAVGSTFNGFDGEPVTTDQRGMPRGPTPDIGAFQDYPITFSTTSGDDQFKVVESGSNVLKYVNGVQTNTYALAGLDAVTISSSATGGNDTLVLDVPDVLLNLTLESNVNIRLTSSTALSTLTLNNGSKLIVGPDPATDPGGATTLVVETLAISGSTDNWSAQLDLQNNGLILQSGDMADTFNQIANGYNAGNWTGQGIVTSRAPGASDLTSIGVALGSDFPSGIFDGVLVNASDVVLSYTYLADANLDYTINGTDGTLITDGTDGADPWRQGDFNYDGVVNSDDFSLYQLAVAHFSGNVPFGATTITEGEDYALTLPGSGPWTVNWGDGQTDSNIATSPAHHTYSTAGVLEAINVTGYYVPVRVAVTAAIASTSPTPIEIDLNWPAVPNADFYEIYRDTDSSFTSDNFTLAGQPAGNSFTDYDGLIPSTIYYYKVIAIVGQQDDLVGIASTSTISGPAEPSGMMEIQDDDSPPVNISLQAQGANDSEILVTWDTTKLPEFANIGKLEISSDNGATWTDVDPSTWGAYGSTPGDDFVSLPVGAFLVRNLQRGINYQFKLNLNTYDPGSQTWIDYGETNAVSAQVIIPQYNNMIYVVGGFWEPMDDLLSTSPETGKFTSVGAIWWQLVQDGYNAYLSPEADEPGSVFTWNGYGFGYQEIQNEVQNRGMTDLALIGYSHGGGMIYNLANTILSNNILPPYQNSISFAGTIDAVQRLQNIHSLPPQPLTSAPGGANSGDINLFQSHTPLFHGAVMPNAQQNSRVDYIFYTDPSGKMHAIKSSHTTIYLDSYVRSTIIKDCENRIFDMQ